MDAIVLCSLTPAVSLAPGAHACPTCRCSTWWTTRTAPGASCPGRWAPAGMVSDATAAARHSSSSCRRARAACGPRASSPAPRLLAGGGVAPAHERPCALTLSPSAASSLRHSAAQAGARACARRAGRPGPGAQLLARHGRDRLCARRARPASLALSPTCTPALMLRVRLSTTVSDVCLPCGRQ